jgi:hypothetical protein
MDRRLELHETLCEIINMKEADGDRHVYFQPPESLKMKYPAIRYSLDSINTKHANGHIYKKNPGYSVTLIDKNPDSGYVDKLLKLPHCRFNSAYPADNLNHFNFTIY